MEPSFLPFSYLFLIVLFSLILKLDLNLLKDKNVKGTIQLTCSVGLFLYIGHVLVMLLYGFQYRVTPPALPGVNGVILFIVCFFFGIGILVTHICELFLLRISRQKWVTALVKTVTIFVFSHVALSILCIVVIASSWPRCGNADPGRFWFNTLSLPIQNLWVVGSIILAIIYAFAYVCFSRKIEKTQEITILKSLAPAGEVFAPDRASLIGGLCAILAGMTAGLFPLFAVTGAEMGVEFIWLISAVFGLIAVPPILQTMAGKRKILGVSGMILSGATFLLTVSAVITSRVLDFFTPPVFLQISLFLMMLGASLLFANVIALWHSRWGRILSIVGIICGVSSIALAISVYLAIPFIDADGDPGQAVMVMMFCSSITFFLLVPVWFIWMGLRLILRGRVPQERVSPASASPIPEALKALPMTALSSVGALCALLAGLSYIGVGITFLADTGIRYMLDTGDGLALVIAVVVSSVLVMLSVPSISFLAAGENKRRAFDLMALGWIGFLYLIVEFSTTSMPRHGKFGYLSLVITGIYFLTVGLVAFRQPFWPKLLALLGILCGVSFCLMPILSLVPPVADWLVVICSFVLLPVWFICLGLWLFLYDASKERGMPKRLKQVLAAGGGIVVVAAAASWVAGLIAARNFDTFLAEMKSQGAIVELADLRSARPPGTKFFEGPLEESALGFIFSDEAAQLTESLPLRESGLLAGFVFELEPEKQEQARRIAEEHQKLIHRIEKICMLPPTRIEDIIRIMEKERSDGPRLLPARHVLILLLLDAYVAYEDGKADDVLKACRHILLLGDHLRDYPDFINIMIASAMECTVTNFLRYIALDGDYSDEAVKSLMEKIEPSVMRRSLALAFIGDLLLDGRTVFNVIEGRAPQADMPSPFSGLSERQHIIQRIYRLPFFRCIRIADEKALIIIAHEKFKAASLPYYEKNDADTFKEDMNPLRWYTPIASIMSPNLLRAKLAHAESEKALLCVKVALAANRHKRATGEYPASISAMVPQHLPEVPINPLTGNEMTLKYVSKEAADSRRETDEGWRLRYFYVGGPQSDKRLLID